MAVQQGNTGAVTRRIARSIFAIDVMWRIWDAYNNVWISASSRSIWASKVAAEKVAAGLIKKGRDPKTIVVTRVFVEVNPSLTKV